MVFERHHCSANLLFGGLEVSRSYPHHHAISGFARRKAKHMSRQQLGSLNPRFSTTSGRRAALSVVLACLLLAVSSRLSQAQVADGFWTAHGRGLGDRCADWTVRLAVEQGRLTGVLSLYRGNITLQNAVLRPDGSFSADTPQTYLLNKYTPPYQVAGRFSGNMANVTLKGVYCPDRRASATRRLTAY
jgi:hypothetical protein